MGGLEDSMSCVNGPSVPFFRPNQLLSNSPSDMLCEMRVFKNRWLDRWARSEDVSDAILFKAAEEILMGRVEANLGGCLFKKRISRAGAGKSGAYRTIVGYRRPNSERIIFLYAFAKNQRANITGKEEAALSFIAETFIEATDEQLDNLLAQGSIWEVRQHE